MSDLRSLTGSGLSARPAKKALILFRDPVVGARELALLLQRIPLSLADTIPSLLADSPDPDSALLLFDRLLRDATEENLQLLERHPHLAHYALVIFGYSRFLGETLLQNPDLLESLLREKSLDQTFSHDEFRAALKRLPASDNESALGQRLARFKRRQYVRIMLRDVLDIAPLAETTAEISALADVLIESALEDATRWLRERYPADEPASAFPAAFSVLSLGKLGGNELNYSSDVDLLYIFGNGPERVSSLDSRREYFIRLAQRLTEILSGMTSEGPTFRIDMRLRPQGSQGELAVSLAHALQYYAAGAADWELQALIKVRHSAGDARLSRAFIQGVQSYVYTKDINLAAIGTASQARERINHRPRHFGPLSQQAQSIDVKLDRGGIRDIEFLVQCLQRVYGGAEPWLRSGGTMFSLQKLHDKRHISGRDFQELNNTYVFLRHVEHRLQLRQGQQTHRLPAGEDELRILQRSLPAAEDQVQYDGFPELIRERMAAVAEIYHRIIQQQGKARGPAPDARYELRSAEAWTGPDASNDEILRRLAADSPPLYELVARQDMSAHARRLLFRFLSSLWTSSERYAAALRYPEAVPRALALFQASDYLSEILIRHPEEMATLAQLPEMQAPTASGYLFDTATGRSRSERDPVFAYIASSDLNDGDKLALLRRHYRHLIFASGSRDITEFRAIYESLASTTAAAEDAVVAAFEIAGAPPDLSILAVGRLGSSEFDLLSDADLIFSCEENADRVMLTKAAERVMQILAAYTRDGMVFSVDTRLRPHGREGELVVTLSQFAVYCAQEAQPWEALTYTKLRPLAGSPSLGERTLATSHVLFQRWASDAAFVEAVREMRAKLESAETERSLKTSAGAIYDIDFLSSYLLAKNHVADKRGTLRDRLWRCADAGLIPKADAALLDHAAEFLRTVDHVLRLVTGRATKGLPGSGQSWQIAQDMTAKILRREFHGGLESELESTCGQVRATYERLLKQ